MKIHKEGYSSIALSFVICCITIVIIKIIFPVHTTFHCLLYILFFLLLVEVILFFRSPQRKILINENAILCPADGKIVVIEEVDEKEFFNEKRIQVSIFMSPLNVHLNRFPISGIIKYVNYYRGKYLVAYHPKSSYENERTAVIIEDKNNKNVLIKQIAGCVARRIVCYAKAGNKAIQGEEMGFIKFGSRVDLLLPANVKLNVLLNQRVQAGITVIAFFN